MDSVSMLVHLAILAGWGKIMEHEIYTVINFAIVAPYTLWIQFDDESIQVINFWPILRGELYSPLRDLVLFNQVQLDADAGTLVWPNKADFDPATLHDWATVGEAMIKLTQAWPEPASHAGLQGTSNANIKGLGVRKIMVNSHAFSTLY